MIRIRKESGFTAVSAPSSPTHATAMVATSGKGRNHPTGHTSGGYASPATSGTDDELTPPGLVAETDPDDDSITHLHEQTSIEAILFGAIEPVSNMKARQMSPLPKKQPGERLEINDGYVTRVTSTCRKVKSGYVPKLPIIDTKKSKYLWGILDTACNQTVGSVGWGSK